MAERVGLVGNGTLSSTEPEGWDTAHLDSGGAVPSSASPFHQMVLLPDAQQEPDWETIQRLIYRADLDAIEEHSTIRHPEELNRRPGQLVAVGRFGSVMWGVQDYVESSALLSASLVVSAASVATEVRASAHNELRQLRSQVGDNGHGVGRASLRAISELGADLTFGAEAHASIAHVFQSLRVESYHNALFRTADVQTQIDLAARMLDRVAAIANVEIELLADG